MTELISSCIAYDGSTIYDNVKFKVSESVASELIYYIGTADDLAGTNLVWEAITLDTNTIISTPNKALFYKVVINTDGATLTTEAGEELTTEDSITLTIETDIDTPSELYAIKIKYK